MADKIKIYVDWEIERVIFELEKLAFEKAHIANRARAERGLKWKDGLEIATIECTAISIIRQLQQQVIDQAKMAAVPNADIKIDLPPIVDKPIPKRRKKPVAGVLVGS